MADTLASPEVIKALAKQYEAALKDPGRPYGAWCENLARYLNSVRGTSEKDRMSIEFQQELWDGEVIAATGQGNVSVEAALQDAEFRRWVARLFSDSPGLNVRVAPALLRQTFERLKEKVVHYAGKTPRLKIFRVLATIYPGSFTTIADIGRMRRLHDQMFPARRSDDIERHRNVLDRLDEVLGPAGFGMSGWAQRMTLPWFLLEQSQKSEPAQPADRLSPLPAIRRRRGMTPAKGSYQWVVRVLDFVGEGTTRDDLRAHLKQEHPGVKDATIEVKVNILRSELNVLVQEGDLLVPSEAGRRIVENDDPSALAPWLLTRILGLDHVLAELRDRGPVAQAAIIEMLQSIYPGWTSDFVPQSILGWLRSFGVTELSGDGRLQLTARGKEWAALIHWTPESLGPEEANEDERPAPAPRVRPAKIARPTFDDIYAKMPASLHFTKDQIATLHAGLWLHDRRHFAILTGLSGSGKTSLASSYASALISLTSGPESVERQFLTVPVAPGWTDPTPLLGYLNPLRIGEYVRTPFLRLLLSCAAQPEKIHVAVLDEMNLSHPEQYLAPLLSGMELGNEPLVLHGEEEDVDGVPGRLDRYPANMVLIGTVNMDETTHGLSDKVLDRAITLEFWDIDLERYPRWGDRELQGPVEARVKEVLGDLLLVLSPVRLHFGWRVVDDVLDFMKRTAEDGHLAPEVALDRIVYSKIVPKLRGYDSKEFRKVFDDCRQLLHRHGLKQSERKVVDLLRDLEATGSARFWR